MQAYNEALFRQKVAASLEKIKQILDGHRTLSLPEEVHHKYQDKYSLANTLVNTSLLSTLNVLSSLGITPPIMKTLVEWSTNKSVTLRLESLGTCTFLREEKKEVEEPIKSQTQVKSTFGNYLSENKTIITTIEYHFELSVNYRLVAVRGVGERDSDGIVLLNRESTHHIIQRVKDAPFPAQKPHKYEVNITWLLQQMSVDQSTGALKTQFFINQSKDTCHTPRRNSDVNDYLTFNIALSTWSSQLVEYFSSLFGVVDRYPLSATVPKFDQSLLNASDIFVPNVPLFEDTPESITDGSDTTAATTTATTVGDGLSNNNVSVVPSPVTWNELVQEEGRTLEAKHTQLSALTLPANATTVASHTEACVIVSLLHMKDIIEYFYLSIDYVEDLIRKQVVAAIGKVVQPSDFNEYMKFHLNKFFKSQYQPKPFCHSVRRSVSYSPEGTVKLGETLSLEPLTTLTCSADASSVTPMQFALNSSTTVTFNGERHLHALLLHSFSGSSLPSITLTAEARQFSGYIVLLGRIASATVFQPKYGIIVQNKDEISIPLGLEQLPTPKEFKDAIQSLSPQQQEFAQAYRQMQLESTLFGICIIQIKPQMEKLLKLSADSLTKEIRLTQDLMELFIKYQIPSDLLTFSGTDDSDSTARLTNVKANVKAIQDMLQGTKDQELAARMQEHEFAHPAPVSSASMPQTALFGSSQSSSNNNPITFGGFGFGNGPTDGNMGPFRGFVTAAAVAPTQRSANMFSVASAPAPESRSFSAAPPQQLFKSATFSFEDTGEPTSIESPPLDESESETIFGTDQELADGADVNQNNSVSGSAATLDYTKVPGKLDKVYEKFDTNNALSGTIITPKDTWTKKSQKALLSPVLITSTLNKSALVTERSAAFDLLDALSRSGALTLDDASLHVVMASTHRFDQTLMDTIVQENVNPIERVERSALLMAATVHNTSARNILMPSQVLRVSQKFPSLLDHSNP